MKLNSLTSKLSIVLFCFILLSCSKSEQQLYVHLNGATMGTTFTIKFPDSGNVDVDELELAVKTRLYEINKLMSTYDPESELSRFNQHRYASAFTISDETALVLREAIRLGALSDGVLDVTVGPLVNLWGFGPTKRPEKIPTAQDVQQVREYVGLNKLSLKGNQLTKSHALVYVDLSTIAKGYGVDQLAELVEQQGIKDYLVEIGGEMRVSGTKWNDRQWSIAIEKPLTQERAIQKLISIGNNAIATSGDYRNYYEEDGVRYSHLIDPIVGKPIQHNTVSVAVVHPSSMVADGLATAFNVMAFEKAFAVAQENDISALFIIEENGQFNEIMTSAFERDVTIH